MIKKKKGFTLIEVTLVLALMGSILVIVFLGVSQAQKNRRDSQRKGDLGQLAKLVTENIRPGYEDTPGYTGTIESIFDRKDPSTGVKYIVNTPCASCHSGNSGQAIMPNPSTDTAGTIFYFDNYANCHTPGRNKNNTGKINTYYGGVSATDLYTAEDGIADGLIKGTNNAKHIEWAVVVRLEQGGYYCIDSGRS